MAFQSQLKLYSAPRYISICVLFNYTSVEMSFNNNKSKPTSLYIIIMLKGPENIVIWVKIESEMNEHLLFIL